MSIARATAGILVAPTCEAVAKIDVISRNPGVEVGVGVAVGIGIEMSIDSDLDSESDSDPDTDRD